MFLQKKTIKSTPNYSDKISRLKKEIETSDAVVIGAGAGISTSAGFTYSGERFKKYFQDFIDKYGFRDMYSGGFYPFDTSEEHWAYWSRYIYINRYLNDSNGAYEMLFDIVKNKNYFVLTTNVDHQFQKAGFDKHKLFYTQGDYGLFQCPRPCCMETFDNEEIIKQMYFQQKNMRIPSELIPRCPHCGRELTMNLRADDRFVEDEGWNIAQMRYSEFLRRHKNMHILFLELGVGYNTPVIIKYPFWQMTAANPKAVYACINYSDAVCPNEIKEQSICIDGDISGVLKELVE